MSSDADAAAATVALFNTLYIGEYCNVAAAALFIYDVIVTFAQEVVCFWTSKRAGAALLFFVNKWISVTYYVMLLARFAPFSTEQRWIALEALEIMQFVPWAVFSALRAYVLSRNIPLGIIVLALSLAPVGSNLVRYAYDVSGVVYPPFGCVETDYTTEAVNFRDALRVDLRRSKRPSLQDILFRDGTIYFVILFVLNILHLIFSLTALASTDNNGTSDVTSFTAPLTAILISRFLLDLQEANQAVVRIDDPQRTSRNPWDDTPSIISSLGAFIDPDRPARSDDDMEWDVDLLPDGEDDGGAEVSETQAGESSSSSAIAVSSSFAAAASSTSSSV
ncbi:hypothetical protein K466DRAFT_659526 [Polyporus arcularius HHB13444]|uniref:DUF6533 domain-containing protein n=1 Tax=Polyporus arcularius HHB13444 TaxID=1314778 RepID=A0A5C3PRR0_9APHY|nr:hypothetical protein K466DRAFT_659526 [Polyporus arcularius HHB13444]